MASAFYSVRCARARVKVLAKDNDAKQVLWGWGSDKSPSIEFYGRGTGRGCGDGEIWEWDLTSNAVTELRRNLKDQLARPKYFQTTVRENKAAAQLLKKLGKCR